MAEIPTLRKDGRNWSTWCKSLEQALNELGVRAYLSGTKPNPYDEQANAIAKCAIASSIPDSLFLQILNFESAHEYFKTLKNLLEMDTFTMELLQEIQNNRVNDHVRTCAEGSSRHTPSPPPPSTPNLPFRQLAPTPRQSMYQRRRDSEVPRTGTRRTREDVKWSEERVESRSQGSEEADYKDGDDVDVDHAHVMPQTPHWTRQMAIDEATDATNPNTTSIGPAMPMGRSYRLPNASNKGEKGGEEDEKGEWASGIETPSSNDDSGDEDVRHTMLLEGEMTGQQSSGHNNETATHLEHPRRESSTPQPRRTPYDKTSNREGRGEAASGDDEVEGSEDNQSTSYGDDEWRCQREKARDEARDDKEGQQNKERGQTTEEHRTAAMNANDEDDAPPPQPPSPPTPPALPPHPERHDNDNDTKSNKMPARHRADAVHDPGSEMDSPGNKPLSVRLEGESSKQLSLHVETDDVNLKSSKTAARMRADALHNPGGQMNSPGSKPPSVELKGERIRWSSLHVKADDIETNNDRVENDHDTQQSPRRPVGTTDGNKRHPNRPTEPPDKEKGVDGGYSEQEVELTVKHIETNEVKGTSTVKEVKDIKDIKSRESRRGDEPRGRGGNGVETREVEGEERGQSKDDACRRDGRTIDTGDATSSASCNSLRVETGALADDKAGQQCNGKLRVSTNSPEPSTPPTPLPYATKRPTHHPNLPHRQGRLKMAPTNVSKPKSQPDAMEAAQGYWGSVPKPPDPRLKGTEAHTSTPHTVNITHTPELPYWVITQV
ncbi:hypothetical protein PAXINDRAFT_15101 [Paxillus involutus ATCC 200175]|uniref:Uncharacterized protein n=1 Tax=Paxillus involutus ATCC 200175 TaxID=664439 RepID=A0A0C9TNE8_PAXIN|nr:hypothetical protein PAXINDRAFT_15101 [Paxillus involutus ATCC 200175]